jgi:hypothetical protein
VFRPKKTRITLYSTLSLQTLLYGSDDWTIKARDARRITSVWIKYMRITAGYTWTDHKTNTEIAKELILHQFYTKYRTTREIGHNM